MLLDTVLPKARSYYALTVAGLSGAAALSAALLEIGQGGRDLETILAVAGGAGLMALTINGSAAFIAGQAWRVVYLQHLNGQGQPQPVEEPGKTQPTRVPPRYPELEQIPGADTKPENERYLMTRRGGVFDTVTGVLHKQDSRKRTFAADATEIIGRLIVSDPSANDEYIYLDVALGWWRFGQYWREGMKTTEGEWCGGGKPFSLPEFRALRHWIIDVEHLGYWKSSRSTKQGWELTRRARAILRSEALHPGPPLPQKVKLTDPSVVSYVRTHLMYGSGYNQ
jgi:hypothetical protein